MKKAVQLAFCACLLAISTFGQDAAAPKTNTTIQCRALNGSSTPIRADEKVIGDQICRAVQKAAQATAQTQAPTTPQSPTAKHDSASVSTAPAAEDLPNSVFTAPMNGFETYPAAPFYMQKLGLTVAAD